MNFGSNASLDLAALRESQERDAMIAQAIAAVATEGAANCTSCGFPIPEERRAAAPFARRCIECQTFLEQEKFHR
ncbi:phage/conjugal plasmid C-4 type zinc finger TraR family protein [Rhizobium petrolearium]|uniref:TraR/DksA C4-type zinc finger protein n=1 Tax=Neorhizobium petrolearium TaxID=515361 RepID=UPI001AE3CBDD|nr:TraR/DksA C4-type zinc finger protein [Neorhizobium petrolearium]MBP1844775.1 phage/conjugal plasmid C-4 type zinc finger TraR family protein [Neorhizobium petrolearium]